MDKEYKKHLQYIIDRTLENYENAINDGSMIIDGIDKTYVLEDQIRLTATPFSFYGKEDRLEMANMWITAFKNHPSVINILNDIS